MVGYEYVYSLYAKNLANHFGNLYVTQRPKQAEEDAEDDTEQMALEENGESTGTREGIRDNAICFRGNPIANLPTQRIFAYVSHSVTPPLGLEWVNDTNVVLVWKTTSEAKDAYQSMREAGTLDMEEDDEGFVPARPIPQTLAPMELRLEKALGKTTLEQEQIWMRWARTDDVKEKGGRNKSKFYEKYGENAGKEGQNVFSSSRRSNKRKRDDPDEDLKRKLDAGQYTCWDRVETILALESIYNDYLTFNILQSSMDLQKEMRLYDVDQSHPAEEGRPLHHDVIVIGDQMGDVDTETTNMIGTSNLGSVLRVVRGSGMLERNGKPTNLAGPALGDMTGAQLVQMRAMKDGETDGAIGATAGRAEEDANGMGLDQLLQKRNWMQSLTHSWKRSWFFAVAGQWTGQLLVDHCGYLLSCHVQVICGFKLCNHHSL